MTRASLCCLVWMLASCGGPTPPTSCTTDAQCVSGSFCDDSSCRTQCEADLDCESAGLGTCDAERGRCGGSSADGGGRDGGLDGGRPDAPSSSCDEDNDGEDSIACGGEDCDDTDARVRPGLPDTCGDAIDQDCDGRVDEDGALFRDVDNDGRGDPAVPMGSSCTPTPGWVSNDEDCDDNSQTTYLGARERCDGRDNDCSLPGAMAGGADSAEDVDGDGHSPLSATCLSRSELGTGARGSEYEKDDCDDADATSHPGADEICTNSVDENCNGVADDPTATVYRDADGDGHGTPGASMVIMSCAVPAGWSRASDDCDDGRATRYVGALEVCDRIDNDCSTPATPVAIDEDVDGDGHAAVGATCLGRGDALAPPTAFPRDDCADDDAATHPGATDYCDGQDRDCSTGGGVALDEDGDGDGHSPIGAMCIGRGEPGAPGSSFAKDDCDDAHAAAHGGLPASADTSTCDGLDNDCDPLTTEIGVACPSGGFCTPGGTCA